MAELIEKIESLAAHVKEYADVKVEMVKLSVADKTSTLLSNIIAALIIVLVATIFILFISIGTAIVISNWIGNNYAGFYIIAGFYLLTGIVIAIFRERMIRVPVLNAIIRQMFNKDEPTDQTTPGTDAETKAT